MWQLFSCILEHSATTLLLSSNTHPRELYFFWVFVCISSLRLLSIWFFFLHESQIHAKEFLSFLGSKYAQLQCTLHSGSFFFFKKLLKYKKCQELFCHFLSFFFWNRNQNGQKIFCKNFQDNLHHFDKKCLYMWDRHMYNCTSSQSGMHIVMLIAFLDTWFLLFMGKPYGHLEYV